MERPLPPMIADYRAKSPAPTRVSGGSRPRKPVPRLTVVTVVLFGGVSIFGGKGTIIGVILAVCVIGGIQSALTLDNVSAQAQEVVTGCLLIVSVVLPNSGATVRDLRARLARPAAKKP